MSMYRLAFGLSCYSAAAVAQSVPFEKYELPNGMTVILHEDHTLPVVAINTWFYVGSKDERFGRSGFAHLFEHLMFMGTRRVPEGQFDAIMEAGGGWNNASTSEDRTNYFSYGPSNLLPTLLWLDAERLESLGANMTLEKLNKQRDVVRNERRQTSENTPYGRAELRIPELMFPPGHPYHHTVIGSHEDLQAATVDDVKNFFAEYYVPCNASLVVAGDFKSAEVKPLIERLFGTLPRGSQPVHAEAGPVTLDRVKRSTMSDNVEFPRIYMVYHSPAHFAPGDAEMDIAALILSDGITSRLYQALMYGDNKLATEVEAHQYSMHLGSMFWVVITTPPDADLALVERTADQVLAEFAENGPSPNELEQRKSQLEYMMLSNMQSILDRADALNQYQFAFKHPDSFQRDLDRYRTATVASVRDWSRKVFTPNARLILRVLPENPTPPENPRDIAPAAWSESEFTLPEPAVFRLSNGVEVRHWRRPGVPLTGLSIVLGGGATMDTPETAGLASITADMLLAGAGDRDAIQFEDALKSLGAELSASVDREWSSLDLEVLTRNLDGALPLLVDAISRPQFDPKEWKRVRRDTVNGLEADRDDPMSVANIVGLRVLFGDSHPYGLPIGGMPEAVRGLELDQVKALFKSVYTPANAVVLSAGDLTAEEMKTRLDATLGRWKVDGPAGVPALRTMPSVPRRPLRVVLIHRPEAVQTVVRYFAHGVSYSSDRRPMMEVLSTILGGSFTSRLNQNLRERHGYTYGARCSFVFGRSAGYFNAGASVMADVTGESLKEFKKEFDLIRSGDMTEAEVAKARLQIRMELVESLETIGGLLETAGELVHLGLPLSSLAKDLATMQTLKTAELNAMAREALAIDEGVLVLVGDRSVIRTELNGLGLPEPEEFSVAGEPIGDARPAELQGAAR